MTHIEPVRRQQHGFTLIEVMMTVTIAAIILSLAMPSFSAMLKQNRLSAQTTSFMNALQYARSTALTTNVPTAVCPRGSTDSASCGSDWSIGWIVVTAPASGTATLLQSYQIGPRDPILSPVAIGTVTPASLTFDSRGLATTQGNFKICDSRGASFARSVQVSLTGMVQAGQTAGKAIWDNTGLTCP